MLTNDPSVQSQSHEMRLKKTYSTGAEEWHCTTCGRRFVLQWSPAYKRIVLEAGDEYVTHSGGKAGIQMTLPKLSVAEEGPLLSDELRSAIEEILEDIDFDNWDSPPN